ncbi:glycerol kinase GlpK [Rhizomonospora bruguierae]|uniref:glycerol kinase GlpK n=1 Tax=Rhizomonospora bruguierae TaxID=1581705 RepID=UPI001BCAF17C|nr:glycerol kinase GlpK [Micromonospora sp. NBRC 107566]
MTPHTYIAAIDQGTTSTRCIVFDAEGRIVSLDQREHEQIYPRPGWVEHDAREIWHNVQAVTQGALDRAGLARADLSAIGITNQRETTLLWDAKTLEPVGNAIVWQDTRTDGLIRELAGEIGQDRFRGVSGLPLATYFAGPKIRWLLDADPDLRARAENGEVHFGTMDTWLIANLTGRHATDVTNASRTMLMNLQTLDWDDDLLAAMGVPRAILPEILPSSHVYGEARQLNGVPVAGALGDQQAALFGQTCFAPGEAKCTYGTGSFLLLNTGSTAIPSEHGLISTVGYRIGDEPAVYALEGSIAVTGALVQWLRDNLGIIGSAPEVNDLAATVTDNGGCYVVPAFSGLYAPHWRPDARGVIAGLTGYVTKGHLARATLEATAWQVKDVVDAMNAESTVDLTTLKADGGMTASELLMQFQADVLEVPVVRPTVAETTCLGAAYAAGLAVGFWPDLDTLRANWRADREWTPGMATADRDEAHRLWQKAVDRSLNWLD